MAKLDVTLNQTTLILTPVDTHLENAFAEGVEVSPIPYLDKMPFYGDRLKPTEKTGVKDVFRQVMAAFVKVMNMDRPGLGTPTTPVTVTLAKITGGGTNGSLTIVGGLIVAKTDPT